MIRVMFLSFNAPIVCKQIVSTVLDQLNKVVVTQKHAYDIISRLFIDLPKFTPAQLIEFTEYCTGNVASINVPKNLRIILSLMY